MSQEKYSLDELRIDRGEGSTRKPRKWKWGIVAAIILLLIIAMVALQASRPLAVRTQMLRAASTGGSQTVLNASGYVVARRKATVSAKTTGKVVKVLIEEGMKVEAGQVLAQLDDSNIQAGLQASDAQLGAAQASLDETRAQLANAEKEYKRVSDLAAQKIASASDADTAEANMKALRGHLNQLERQAIAAEKDVAVWQQQKEDMVIRAPFAGIAISKDAQPGEMISPISAGGGFTRTGIGTIVDMTSLEIEVDVNESSINRVKPEQPVEAALDAYPEWKIPGHVLAIIPTADRQKATVKVRVAFDQLDSRILPDMGVRVAFKGERSASTSGFVVVPKTAVRKDADQNLVWVVRNRKLEKRIIIIANIVDNEINVSSGLSAGDKVVVEGPAELAEGKRVRELAR